MLGVLAICMLDGPRWLTQHTRTLSNSRLKVDVFLTPSRSALRGIAFHTLHTFHAFHHSALSMCNAALFRSCLILPHDYNLDVASSAVLMMADLSMPLAGRQCTCHGRVTIAHAMGGSPVHMPWAGRQCTCHGRVASAHAMGGSPLHMPWTGVKALCSTVVDRCNQLEPALAVGALEQRAHFPPSAATAPRTHQSTD
jgi:hypothetical protein